MHLSRVLVRTGQHVEQGQRIGLVGMTGLATGPHLDFRIQQHGQFLNFERLGLPTADPISKRDWTEFATLRDAAMTHMPDLPPRADTPVVAKNTKPRRSRGADYLATSATQWKAQKSRAQTKLFGQTPPPPGSGDPPRRRILQRASHRGRKPRRIRHKSPTSNRCL